MNSPLSKTYPFFFSIIPLILIFSYCNPKNTFDVNIGDTYFVILNLHLGILLSVLYAFLGLIHFFLSKKGIEINLWITYTHTTISIGGLILIWTLLKLINNDPTQNIEETIKTMHINEYLNFSCIILFIGILLIQIIFFSAILWRLVKNLFSA